MGSDLFFRKVFGDHPGHWNREIEEGGKHCAGSPAREAGETDLRRENSCRSFFQSMYYKVAESLPDRFIRRKRKRTTHGHKRFQYDTDDSSFYEADGEEEQNDDADLFAWLDKATDGPLHSIALNSSNLVQRFLPPGNLTELYDHYQVVQSMLGISPASSFGCICLSSTVQLY